MILDFRMQILDLKALDQSEKNASTSIRNLQSAIINHTCSSTPKQLAIFTGNPATAGTDMATRTRFSMLNKNCPHLWDADQVQRYWILRLYSITENSIINFLGIKKDLFSDFNRRALVSLAVLP